MASSDGNETLNPYDSCKDVFSQGDKKYTFYNLNKLSDSRYGKLPYSIRVLLESAVRNCDGFHIQQADVEKILDWSNNQTNGTEVPFKPSRVILQDFTGVPAVVDFAAMRDAVKKLGGDPENINPVCPVDLVIDHSVQVDVARSLLQKTPNPGGGDMPMNTPTQIDSTTKRAQKPQTPPLIKALANPDSPLILAPPSFSPSFKKFSSQMHPTQSRIKLNWRDRNPLCERSSSAVCDKTACSTSMTSSPKLTPRKNNRKRQSSAKSIQSSLCTLSTDQSESKANGIITQSAVIKPCRGAAGCCRESCCRLPGNEGKICRPTCPFHNLKSAGAEALEKNQDLEFVRNKERFKFLKWGAKAFKNMLIVPPGSGIVHQVNLEYLARLVFSTDGSDGNTLLYPDSLVGTDSHTTMINGLGVVGWGVGGIEAEAVMLGQAISMVLPEVIGYKIDGSMDPMITSTDVVLTITKHLRSIGVVGKFVEFYGPGVRELSLADRATISNMCPEYGATVGYFTPDEETIQYLRQTGRDESRIEYIKKFLELNSLSRDYANAAQDPEYSKIVELDLSTVVPCCSGPKRPHDRVPVSDMMSDFKSCLDAKQGFKGFAVPADKQAAAIPIVYENQEYTLTHGDVVIAAITSCTNTSNPTVMLGAGLMAKKAVERGLSVKSYIKTSLSPGSGVVTYYLNESGVTPYLQKLGFDIVGYGCMTCIGNSGPLPEAVSEAIDKADLVACGVLSGNRNFEGRIHPLTRANYLASPMLVVAYALAGTVCLDFVTTPLGQDQDGNDVFLKDIWPTRTEIQAVEKEVIVPALFNKVYNSIQDGNEKWNLLEAPTTQLYPWDSSSTYIKNPPFFHEMTREPQGYSQVESAYALLNVGDSVTTDHISPAGSIARNSPAARYLTDRGLTPKEFNSYGARRGNDDVMCRGTFANIRLVNKLANRSGPITQHIPSGEQMDVFDCAMKYKSEGSQVIILAGKEYGSGSSRDWAAKGPYLQGVKAVIAESYERIHRSNLVGMGIIPLQYKAGDSAESLGLTGKERFSLSLSDDLKTQQLVTIQVDDGRTFEVVARFDTEVELQYFRNGGILQYMIRKMI